ncbi:hypothetical protein AMECASPLE_032712 [Ameca splendens]|uniref:Uncharacterized protein n=1 Tax=Ameca splendens TaxID=208324 RepID=A0ABV0ZGI3_9TELE
MLCVYSACPLLQAPQGSSVTEPAPPSNMANKASLYVLSDRVSSTMCLRGCCVEADMVFVDICGPLCVLHVPPSERDREGCDWELQILIFHLQLVLKPVSLKFQPSAASQVYLWYGRD